ncbi:hypothetical protein EVAR_65494_1 [Eumeta japonica]|uniref:Uncharacterized protein n=1 Tax=Eumeta variegata TaxID=151549 RepID=A0A4C2A2S2_EUMVA|nr:hypothetical protein EVAR_65494_1 [Eumeta japonica]
MTPFTNSADELAKNAALEKKTAADYDRFPLSYAKKAMRAMSQRNGRRDTPKVAQNDAGTGVKIVRQRFPELLPEEGNRKLFLSFCEGVGDNMGTYKVISHPGKIARPQTADLRRGRASQRQEQYGIIGKD